MGELPAYNSCIYTEVNTVATFAGIECVQQAGAEAGHRDEVFSQQLFGFWSSYSYGRNLNAVAVSPSYNATF